MARILINLGIAEYFDNRWTEASARYLEALDTAQRAGSVVLAATAAINSAEIQSDQGEWQRSIELLDSAKRNYEAVGYSAGIAAADLFAGVAATRQGQFDDAELRLTVARERLARLGMVEMVDEVDSRSIELGMLTGATTIADCDELARRLGPAHPCIARISRVRGILEFREGDEDGARSSLVEALRLDPNGFDGAQTLAALALVAPDDEQASAWRAEADAIFQRLGVRRAPPLPIGTSV